MWLRLSGRCHGSARGKLSARGGAAREQSGLYKAVMASPLCQDLGSVTLRDKVKLVLRTVPSQVAPLLQLYRGRFRSVFRLIQSESPLQSDVFGLAAWCSEHVYFSVRIRESQVCSCFCNILYRWQRVHFTCNMRDRELSWRSNTSLQGQAQVRLFSWYS